MEEKGPGACDARAPKANSNNPSASCDAFAQKSQLTPKSGEPNIVPSMIGPEWAESARASRAERDKREPLKNDIKAERLALIRDAIFETLGSASYEFNAVLGGLQNDDDVGAVYHFRRLIIGIKAAAHCFRQLVEVNDEKGKGP